MFMKYKRVVIRSLGILFVLGVVAVSALSYRALSSKGVLPSFWVVLTKPIAQWQKTDPPELPPADDEQKKKAMPASGEDDRFLVQGGSQNKPDKSPAKDEALASSGANTDPLTDEVDASLLAGLPTEPTGAGKRQSALPAQASEATDTNLTSKEALERFNSMPGASNDGLILPGLEVLDFNWQTIRQLLHENKARLVARVSQGSDEPLNLLVRLGEKEDLRDAWVEEITRRTISGLSSRNFALGTPYWIPADAIAFLIAEKLGYPAGPITYRLYLGAEFDRQIAHLQWRAVQQARVNYKAAEQGHQVVVTQMRLLGMNGAPQVMRVRVGDKVLPVPG